MTITELDPYRGKKVYHADAGDVTSKEVYYSPYVAGYFKKLSAVHKRIDKALEAEGVPPPEEEAPPGPPPVEDAEYIETYRGIPIWWIPEALEYEATPEPETSLRAKTLEELRLNLDTWIDAEPPGPPQPQVPDGDDPDDVYLGEYGTCEMFLEDATGLYYLRYQGERHGPFMTYDDMIDYIEVILAPPVELEEIPPEEPPEAEPGGEADQLHHIGGLLGRFGTLGELKKDAGLAGGIAGHVKTFLDTIGLSTEAVEVVLESPLNRETAAQLATSMSIATQTGLGILYSVGLIAEVGSLGQIDKVVDVIDNLVTNTGIDEILKPLFGAPFWPSVIIPTRQYWNSKYTPEIPPSQDMITMVVREVIDPDVFKEYMAYQGFSGTWADRYWEAHWRLPSRDEVIAAFHRKVISEEEKDKYLVWHDYRPEARPGIEATDVDIISALQKTPIPRVDVRRGFKLGAISEELMLEKYGILGYEEDAELMASIQKRAAFEALQNAVIREAGKLYAKEKITADDFKAVYDGARETYDEWTLWLMRYDLSMAAGKKEEEELYTQAELEAYTVSRLREIAYDMGLDVPEKILKDALVGLILAAQGLEYEEPEETEELKEPEEELEELTE